MNRRQPMVTINFASTNFPALTKVRLWLAVLSGLLVVCLVFLLLSARSLRVQADNAGLRVRELAASEAKLQPLMEERQRVVGNLNAMTGLLQARRFSWTGFLTRLEEVFPEGLALSRLDYRPGVLLATLDGTAQSPEALSRLMIGLERSRWFKNPLLKRQSMDKGILSFNVTVVYNESAASGPVPVAAQQLGR